MSKKKTTVRSGYKKIFILTSLVSVAVAVSCGELHRGRTQVEMSNLYPRAHQLFTIVWDPSGFSRPSQQKHVQEILASLAKDFHRVGKAEDLRREDPVVAVTLDVTQRLLVAASRDLKEGRPEHAQWRLKGLVHNCVSCHSRTGSDTTFLGAPPIGEPRTYEAAMNTIEFLIASRQFEEAAERLYRLALRAGSEPDFSGNLLPSLRMWLLLEIRTLNRPWEASEKLARISQENAVPITARKLLERWTSELRLLSSPGTVSSPLDRAETLLDPVRKNVSLSEDDWNLISTLRASTLLHDLLGSRSLSGEASARANFLLALSYQHMNIPAFEASRDLYLERCIRAFPGTPESKEAFRLYEWDVRQSSTGSGGTHLDEIDKALLKDLSQIAGSKSGVGH